MRTVKRLIGQGLFASHMDELLFRRGALIVAFHRVQETVAPSDPLTIDKKTFELYCRFFRRHFSVVSLPHLVNRLETDHPPRRELVITFDDGYLDNFAVAAPVLERLSLPATFFVVTSWIGTGMVPFWDRDRGVRHPWMSWDQVRALHRRGFDIGAHTRTHVDLGAVTGPPALDEIAGSRLDLEEQLAAPVVSFAYPFGGREHLTEGNRAFVRTAGFRCCCSGFGGTVAPGANPFELPRVAVSQWYPSPHLLGFDVALGRSEQTA